MRTVLVIDDEPCNLDVISLILARHGCHPIPVSTGEDAIQACERHPGPIDLVVVDVILRGPNGVLVSHRISELRPGVPILFVSGHPREALEGVLSSVAAVSGRFAFLAKPFTADRLLSEVDSLLAKSAAAAV
jgi:DNA-binding NtrC family response regulator